MRETRRHVRIPLGIHAHNDGECAVANSLAAVARGRGARPGDAQRLRRALRQREPRVDHPEPHAEAGPRRDPELHLRELATSRASPSSWRTGRPGRASRSSATRRSPTRPACTSRRSSSTRRPTSTSRRTASGTTGGCSCPSSPGSRTSSGRRASTGSISRRTPRRRAASSTRSKRLEDEGYQFEGAEASFELLMERALGNHRAFFDLEGYRVIVETRRDDREPLAEATVRVQVKGISEHTAATGNGPVNALDHALRKALEEFYPSLQEMRARRLQGADPRRDQRHRGQDARPDHLGRRRGDVGDGRRRLATSSTRPGRRWSTRSSTSSAATSAAPSGSPPRAGSVRSR